MTAVPLWRQKPAAFSIKPASVQLPALLRGQFKRGITSVVRQRQHLGNQRGVLLRG